MIEAIDYRRVSLFLRRLNNTVNALTGNGAFYDTTVPAAASRR